MNVILLLKINLFYVVLRMREKSISGMMAAVHRRDVTDVEEREERISQMKKVIRSQQLSVLMC